MAAKGIEMALAMVLVAMLWNGAAAQSGCTSVLMGLTPCLNYVSGNSSTPSSSCCSQLGSVVQLQPCCLCLLLNGNAASLGVKINQTLALSLPGACDVQTPPVSRCSSANVALASAPSSRDFSSHETPNTSSESKTPLAGAGSKAVPSTQGASSAGSTIRLSALHLALFFLFIMSVVY